MVRYVPWDRIQIVKCKHKVTDWRGRKKEKRTISAQDVVKELKELKKSENWKFRQFEDSVLVYDAKNKLSVEYKPTAAFKVVRTKIVVFNGTTLRF